MPKKLYKVAKPNLIQKIGKVARKLELGVEVEREEKEVQHLIKRGCLVLAVKPKKVESPEEKKK